MYCVTVIIYIQGELVEEFEPEIMTIEPIFESLVSESNFHGALTKLDLTQLPLSLKLFSLKLDGLRALNLSCNTTVYDATLQRIVESCPLLEVSLICMRLMNCLI